MRCKEHKSLCNLQPVKNKVIFESNALYLSGKRNSITPQGNDSAISQFCNNIFGAGRVLQNKIHTINYKLDVKHAPVRILSHQVIFSPTQKEPPNPFYTLVWRGFLSGSDRTKGKSMPLAAERTPKCSSAKAGETSSASNLMVNCWLIQ